MELDGYLFQKSIRPNKKYDVFKDVSDGTRKYITSFGDTRYQQYKDKIGLYKDQDHNDKKRRALYYTRFGNNPKKESAMYFSHRYLW